MKKSYRIPSLGAILTLDHFPATRFVAGATGRYVMSKDISTAPMVEYVPSVRTRAEILLPRAEVAFFLNGVDGVFEVEADQHATATAYNEWVMAQNAAEPEPEPEPEPAPRRRGRPRREPEPEPDMVDEDELAAEDDMEIAVPALPSMMDSLQLVAIDIDDITTDQVQMIPLLDCPAVRARMDASTGNATAINNNYQQMVNLATRYAQAYDRLQQASPVGGTEFSLPGISAGLDDLDSDVRRANASGMQTGVQKLRADVQAIETTYQRVVEWFERLLTSDSAIVFSSLDSDVNVFGEIEVQQKDVVNAFFANEFIEL